MPGPIVYVAAAVSTIAAIVAFKQFVYEPHIAPKIEAWAESYVQNRRQRRQRQRPIPNQPVNEQETTTRRSVDVNSSVMELELLATQERDEWRNLAGPSSLRRRTTAGVLDESDTIAYPIMPTTHVLFDNSSPSSPGGHSIRTSVDSSPAQLNIVLGEPRPSSAQSQLPRAISPGLLTPISNYSLPSSRAMSPSLTVSSSSSGSEPDAESALMRPLSPDLEASSYNTPLSHSLTDSANAQTDPLLNPGPIPGPGAQRQYPFSDMPHVSTSPSGFSRVGSPSVSSDFTVDSDDGFDVLSPRSGMFSPLTRNSRLDDDPFEIGSQHESDVSWMSVGHRSPSPRF